MNPAQFWGGAAAPYEIEQSLRFNSGDTHYLNRTPGSAGNRKTWTWSGWFKRSDVSASTGNFTVFAAQQPSGSDQDGLVIDADGSFYILFYSSDPGGSNNFYYRSDRKLRDPSAWYHIMFVLDTTQAAVDDRCNVWINNEKVVDINTANRSALSQNFEAAVNNTGSHTMGKSVHASDPGDGYLAEVNFIDGTAYTDATAFGEYDDNGVWRPIKYAGSYTGQSWYLKFASGDGTDSSGLSNTWTANNFSTSGTGTDVMSDTPTTNWATWLRHPSYSAGLVSDGNLVVTSLGANGFAASSSIALPSSGKFYYEIKYTSTVSSAAIGLRTFDLSTYFLYLPDGRFNNNGTITSSWAGTWAANDVMGVYYDAGTGVLGFTKNGVDVGNNITVSTTETLHFHAGHYNDASVANFGQRAFEYTPPTGYKALNTANLPAPDIADGSDYFNTVLYTGTNATNAITGVGFAPNFVWVKRRSAGGDHILSDSVRTAGKYLSSNLATSEVTSTDFGSFDSDGFTVNAVDQTGGLNSNGSTYVAWNWLAGNSSGSSNTDGSITSTVSANPSAGFSIVTYTGTGANATVGHGLGVAPEMVIIKRRNLAANWAVYHASQGPSKVGGLDYDGPFGTQGNLYWNSTAPSNTVVSIGTSNVVNNLTSTYVAYCFAEVEGYSKFGSFTGNGSTDGAFVYLGFKPALIILKDTVNAENWHMWDSTRSNDNPIAEALYPNLSAGEGNPGAVDLLSNGFKIRTTNSDSGGSSSGTYIFAAFAENPFGGDGVSPATAR